MRLLHVLFVAGATLVLAQEDATADKVTAKTEEKPAAKEKKGPTKDKPA